MSTHSPRQKQEKPDRQSGARPTPIRACAGPGHVDNLTVGSLYASGLLHAKVNVGGADDPAEAEADRMARSALDGGSRCTCAPGGPPCASCRQNATVRRKPRGATAAPATIGNLGLGAGRRLGDAERGFFESRMHADFSAVRVHDDAHAARANTQLDARAFTFGNDIAFARGEYQPHTDAGRELIAHELAHVSRGHGGIRRQATAPPEGSGTVAPNVRLSKSSPWQAYAPAGADPAAVAQALYGSSGEAPQKLPEWTSLYIGALAGVDEFKITPELLVEPYKGQFYQLMSDRLEADIAEVESLLLETRIDSSDESKIVDHVQWWSHRKDLRTADGRTYFDVFLGRLRQDTWHTDYGVTESASKPFLDKLYTEVDEKVGEVNSLIAQNSREFGAYRPLWARLEDLSKVAQGGAAPDEVNPELVTRTTDLIADRLAGVTTSEDSKVMSELVTGLPPAAQAQVLQKLMSRYDESDWTGIFGRFGEAWQGGMLYFLFEDLNESDRMRVGESLKASNVLPAATVDALVAGRSWGGKYLPFTTRLGHEASEFYAKECTEGEGVGSGASCGALAFSVLWTPETAGSTITTLATAGMGGPVAQAFPTLGKVMLVGGTGLAAYQGTQALVELATGKSMDTGLPLDSTDKLTRGILLASSALFIGAGFMSASRLSAGTSGNALANRPGVDIDPKTPTSGGGAGSGAPGQIPIRIISSDPVTGECTVVGQNPATGEAAVMRINMKTGDGVMHSGAQVRTISRWQLQPERPLLGPAPGTPSAPSVADPTALPPVRYRSVSEILPAPDAPFTEPAIEAAYDSYASTSGAAKSRFDWIRATRGGPREQLLQLLGPNFPGAAESAIEGENVQLSRITRPATLAQSALDQHLATLNTAGGRLHARLARMARGGVGGDEVNLGHFNILKGNIGEILSAGEQRVVLAEVQGKFPDAKVLGDLRMKLPGGQPKQFSDNLICTEADGNLYVRAGFEVKSGPAGGQEATEQIHSWVEGKLEDGAELVLSDGRKFVYAPGTGGPGRVIFLASAPRYIIAPVGSETLGSGSAMGVPGPVHRVSLPVTSEELNYLARLIAATVPQTPAAPATGP